MQKFQELIVDSFAAQKNRLFLWVPFFLSVGIGLYFSLTTEPSLTWALIVSGVLLLVSTVFWKTILKDTFISRVSFLCLLVLSLISVGFTAAKIRTDLIYAPMIIKEMKFANVEGRIKSIEPLEKGSRIVLHKLTIEKLTEEGTPHSVRLKVLKDEGLKAGQRVQVLAALNPPSRPVAPNAFDFQRWSYFHQLGAVGFAYGAPEILEEKKGSILSSIRQSITNDIVQHTSAPEQSIILALMTGQRKAIIEEDWDAMRESGLAHMLAISGLHVGMVAGVLFFFSRLVMAGFSGFALRHPIKKYAAIFALIGAFFYMLIVGATIPTQRAVIMVGLAMIAICLDRSPLSLRLVALAAIIILLYRPESLVSISFQMSFAAVTALVAFFESIRPFMRSIYSRAGVLRKIFLYFLGLSFTTIIAGAITGLFGLFHFQQYAMYGLLANLFAVPILSFLVMPLLVLSYFLMPFGLSALPLKLAEWGTNWVLATAHWVSGLDGAVLKISSYPVWIFIGLVLCCWVFAVWKGRAKIAILPIFACLIILIGFAKQPDIQISGSSDLIAIKSENNLWLSSFIKERFVAENWLRLRGMEKEDREKWPKESSADDFPLSCDQFGCRGEMEGRKVAVSFSDKAWREDCGWADILISQTPVKD
ncbi:MAG: ComEC/Rec2 family competence protein, partial [Pseudomonadota bacterium]